MPFQPATDLASIARTVLGVKPAATPECRFCESNGDDGLGLEYDFRGWGCREVIACARRRAEIVADPVRNRAHAEKRIAFVRSESARYAAIAQSLVTPC